jgi:Tol biopolymer transport system component/photosystem II stability/assembly factor-like uncharacterized protein
MHFMNRNLIIIFIVVLLTTSCKGPIPEASEGLEPLETVVEVTTPDDEPTSEFSSDPPQISSVPPTPAPADTFPPIDYENAIPKYTANTAITITRIGMTSATIGWAIGEQSGDSDHIFRSEDGGKTWWDVTPPEPAPPQGVALRAKTFFLDVSSAWVSYDPFESVWRTTDAGVTWLPARIPMTDASGAAFWFLDTENGWMMKYFDSGMNKVYNALFRTSTGGRFWDKLFDPTSSGDVQSFAKTGMVFADPDIGWITRDPQGVKPGAFVDATSDGGYTWEEVAIPPPADEPDKFDREFCGMFDPHLFSISSGALVITCRYFDDGEQIATHYLALTSDDGATWSLYEYPGGELQFINQDVAYSLGREMYKSIDGGKSWIKIREVAWDGQFNFVDENRAWAVARSEGEIALVYTTDGGNKFYEIKPQVIDPPAAYQVNLPSVSTDIDPTNFGGGSRQISFISCRDNDDPRATDIYLMNISGSGLTEITDSSGLIKHFSWSPDGQRLVFDSDRNGVRDIYTIKVDGSELVQITSNAFDEEEPAWSPDGSQIAYVSRGSCKDAIYLMNTDGSAAKYLIDGRRPAWSPDGTRIAFSRLEDGLFVIDVDGGNLTRLTDSSRDDMDDYPVWSPDGEWILFTSNRHEPGVGGTESVYIMRADGSEISRLTEIRGAGPYTWSPDGQWIAFTQSFGCAGELYVMDTYGSNVRPLNVGGLGNFRPLWRP